MNRHALFAILLVLSACFLLAGCQAGDDEEFVEDTFSALRKLTADDPANDDKFGLSIAVSGSYALISAPAANPVGSDSGAAYLFLQSQGGADAWGQVKKFQAADGAANDLFGFAVDLSGDTAVIGAVGDAADKGAAYVFHRNQGGADAWGQVAKLVASDAAEGDNFGFSVAIDGDTVIVGAMGEDGSGTDEGAAYVFYRNQGGADAWGQVAKLAGEDAENVDQFGYDVDVEGDLVIVAAPGVDGAGTDRGAAYIFMRDLGGSDGWGLVKKLTASNASDSTWFGAPAALSGGVAVIGAAWDDNGGTYRGAAYIFARHQGGTDNWGELKKLSASDPQNNAMFGYAVAIDGDTIIVGAGWDDGGGTERGQAYIFVRNEGGPDNWGEAQRLRASDGANEDWFGLVTAIEGSYLIIGATGSDGGGSERGAAYVFKKI